MAILSTDKKLISFGTDYSAGSGISIIDHTISVIPSAVGKTYSAGPNIGIYDVSGQPTISSKDWTQEIDQSSSGAVTESISYFNTWVNGQYTEDIANVTNNITALSGDLSSYYKKTETSSKAEISAALDYVSAHAVGDVGVNDYVHNNSATINEVNTAYQSNSANYLTAVNLPESATWNDTSNVVKESSASWNQGKTYEGISPIVVNNDENKISADTWTLTAGNGIALVEDSANKVTRIDVTAQGGDEGVNSFVHDNSATIDEVNSVYQSNSASYLTAVNIPESATWNDTSNVVSSNSAQWNQGRTYEGVSPIVVNNDENKVSADTWVLSAGDGISFVEDSANNVTRIDCTAKGDAGVNSFVTSNSASILEVDTSYRTNSGTFLTAIPSDVATTGDVANLELTISETYYPNSNPSSFATVDWVGSQGYLTEHQDVSNKLDSSAFSSVSGDFLTTAFSIPESATWTDTSNVVQSNSAQWAEGGGGSVSSKYETITVDGSDIEATNSAIEFKSDWFISSFGDTDVNEYHPATFTWDNYSEGTTFMSRVSYYGRDSDVLTYSSNTNVTGEISIPSFQTSSVILQLPNATAIQFSANHAYMLGGSQASAASSFQVKELAWKSDLPTYTYNSNKKLSAINGSALVGNEDYLVQQGFVQNLTSPYGTIAVKDNKVEGTNSAVKSDTYIEGFVSAYNGITVFPSNSATLSWTNYVPNTKLTVSGDPYPLDSTLTYSADTDVTGTISTPANERQVSMEVPSNATSIVIGNENWGRVNYNFTVSAEDYYEVGELAWKSDVPTFEYDTSAIDDVVSNVTTNSGVWGGSALPISAGNGIGLSMVEGVLVISVTGGN